MSNVHQGLYPIIRRVRRPLVAIDTGPAASTAAVKPPEPPAKVVKDKQETKTDAVRRTANG